MEATINNNSYFIKDTKDKEELKSKWEDKDFVLEAVKQDGYNLYYASKELRNDREVVLEAIKQNGYALEFASDELKTDKKIVLAAVKQDGLALQFASEKLQADKKIVLVAVKQYGSALYYASKELQTDKELLLEVIKQDPKIIRFDFINQTPEIVFFAIAEFEKNNPNEEEKQDFGKLIRISQDELNDFLEKNMEEKVTNIDTPSEVTTKTKSNSTTRKPGWQKINNII